MNRTWKAVLIGSEVTVLAAFSGVGLHLALQPHRGGQPPPLTLPFPLPAGLPPVGTLPSPVASPLATPAAGIGRDLFRRIDDADRSLLHDQWDVLHRLIGAIEEYLRRRAIPDFARSR